MIINSNMYVCAVILKQIDPSGFAMISGFCEFEAKLVYIVSFKPTSAAHLGPQKNKITSRVILVVLKLMCLFLLLLCLVIVFVFGKLMTLLVFLTEV